MTFREKIKKECPEDIDSNCLGGIVGCPYSHGYESIDESLCQKNFTKVNAQICHECWDREIPGTNSNDCVTTTNEKEKNMATKKTKAELEKELETVKESKAELEKELKNLEKYKQYEDMAGEVHAIYMSFVHAGFSEEQAYDLLKTMIQNAKNITFNNTYASKPTYRSYK